VGLCGLFDPRKRSNGLQWTTFGLPTTLSDPVKDDCFRGGLKDRGSIISYPFGIGWLAERLIAPACHAGNPLHGSGVRIPHHPPLGADSAIGGRLRHWGPTRYFPLGATKRATLASSLVSYPALAVDPASRAAYIRSAFRSVQPIRQDRDLGGIPALRGLDGGW
jgi:hypothetical protein